MKRWSIDLKETSWTGSAEARAAADTLLRGGLVAIPTETVYGLAADATNSLACASIYEAKGRPQFNPLICHIDSIETAQQHGAFDPVADRLAETFWPGPLTLVVPKKTTSPVCDLATAGLDTIALRVPAGPVMRFMARISRRPLAAPSANRSGRISPTTAEHVIADLEPALDFLIDTGPCPVGVESTIVSVVDGTARLLRVGGVEREALVEALGGRPLLEGPTTNDTAPAAPGMMTSHYAPDALVVLNVDRIDPGDVVLAFGPTLPENSSLASRLLNLSPTGNLKEAAANLFGYLRQLDSGQSTAIKVQKIPENGLGEAINDRLRRAAAPR
ncbi:translation factor SUA5 [Roseibium hamelinense]|uniref:Threonylcarbamoyl-AMP synthase n=1 Tax=Roseibium hamelinense TaxID=150831 RepID=A0A562STL6_9HYPH|nr:L-threonylcarbamoyladenylate synthase [Roseibium hamelinense]MTI42706.1 threonylcarbamoyl-AMP synthase [Roseibium hamelinense]TWI84585.1 translation factor SUA5 [Roseibium hamelinense]